MCEPKVPESGNPENLHEIADVFVELIQATAAHYSIPELYVENDYRVTKAHDAGPRYRRRAARPTNIDPFRVKRVALRPGRNRDRVFPPFPGDEGINRPGHPFSLHKLP